MTNTDDLMQRLAVSKKIMEKTENIKRGDVRNINPSVETFEPVEGRYNIPSEILSENTQSAPSKFHDPSQPLDRDKIMNSKLPDEIKRIMIEKPIVQPSSVNGSANISEEVIQGAQRLMNMGKSEQKTQPQPQNKRETINETKGNFDISEMKNLIRDVVRDTVRDVVREELKEAGMLVESTQNSNEVIQIKVGNHLFVGKVTKIKKLEK